MGGPRAASPACSTRCRRCPRRWRPAAGRAAAGSPPAQRAAGGGLWARLTADNRDDLLPPSDPARDVLVVDLAGFESEAFGLGCASRFVSEAVRLGWRNLVGFGCLGGPRYLGANLAAEDGTPATASSSSSSAASRATFSEPCSRAPRSGSTVRRSATSA